MRPVQQLLISLALALGTYFGLTWFFFGSSHPCGILEAMQKPYVLERVRTTSSEHRALALELLKSKQADAVEAATNILDDIERHPNKALRGLHERVWRLTPAQCTWSAIAWNPDPYKGK